jgi:hypothetical protein
MKVKSRNWNEVVKFYDGLPSQEELDFHLMAALVKNIMSSRYSIGLFPVTSMHTLMLGQTPEFEIERNTLSIELEKGNKVKLELNSSAIKSKNWKRSVPANEAFSALGTFFETAKWFVSYKLK